MAIGALLLYKPVSTSAVPALPWLALGSVLWACAVFLPKFLFPLSQAGEILQEDYGFPGAWTVTFQPWITLDACFLLAAGWLWLLSATSEGWRGAERRQALGIWCGGILLLLAASTAAYFLGLDIPGWDSPQHFGPFANRNQMGNLLALGGFSMIVLAYESRERHNSFPWFWLLAAAAIFAGLVLNFSRAGVVLFFAAVGLWMLAMVLMGGRVPLALVVGSVGLLLLSVFLVWGGATLGRFLKVGGVAAEGRPAIHRDAWSMVADVPVLGVGAGNFEAMFPFYRATLQSEHRVLHPESDLLWLGAEMGVPAVLALAAAFLAVAAAMFPFAPRTDRQMRAGCLVAGIVFALHGLMDVSGHRVGTVLPALLLFSMGIPFRHEPMRIRRGLLAGSLLGALAILVVGAAWVGQTLGWVGWPGRAARDFAMEEAEEAIAAREWNRAASATDRLLASAPLAWQGHYQQGRLALAAGLPENQARAAFLRARALDPSNPWIPFRAGLMWWEQDRRDLALSYWSDALADARLHRGEIFNRIAQVMRKVPGQEIRLAQMAARFPDLRVYALGVVPDEEFGPLALQLAESGPLAPAEAAALFEGWERRRTEPDFEAYLEEHPEQMDQGWPWLARRLARTGKAEAALPLMWARLPVPVWPALEISPRTVENARLDLRRNPLNIAAAYVVAKDQEAGGRFQAALETLEPLLGREHCPSYLHYLAASYRHRLGQATEAYTTLEKYRRLTEAVSKN